MRRDHLFLTLATIAVVALLALGSPLGLKVQGALRGPYAPLAPLPELQTLAARLEGYGEIRTVSAETLGKKVPVYSRYPFNFKNELLIAAGRSEGVAVGDTALFQGALLGTVSKVFEHSATVGTVFDSRFKVSVRVGLEGADALLVGGNQPVLQLIPASANVESEDHAYSAAPGMPYGIRIGAVSSVRDAKDGNYKEADLRIPYNPASLSEVVIIPKEGE